MLRKLTVLAALLLALLPAGSALAHGGPKEGVYHEMLTAGKYPLILDFADWPARAQKSNRIIVAPGGGIADKTAVLKLIPPNAAAKPIVQQLETYPGLKDVWMFETAGIPTEGDWTLEIDVHGPEGDGVGTVPLTVAPPPGVPMWLGWLLGLFPLYGVAWFGVREARRVKSLIAQEQRVGA